MFHVVRGRSLANARAASMFENPKALFVDLLDWDVPVVEGRCEIDDYDTGNVEGQRPSVLLSAPSVHGLAAIDALLPMQAQATAAHLAEHEAASAVLLGC